MIRIIVIFPVITKILSLVIIGIEEIVILKEENQSEAKEITIGIEEI